ncbi:MAG: SAM-dependent methyltransferase [Deltaproteobacteria bacterium]|nr:SAM-dependent methyltransferase [Deltaproteobacteria bacterium]
MLINFTPIGTVHTTARNLPRHWSVSDAEGTLEILPEYNEGISDISGLSVLEVISKDGNRLRVKGLDMIDGTPILDIKPHIEDQYSCPSYEAPRHDGTP